MRKKSTKSIAKLKTLYIVVPCYNEEEIIQETTKQLKIKMENLLKESLISKDSRVLFVNDGSKDHTWTMIEEMHKSDKTFTGLSLTNNYGKQKAILAGLEKCADLADIIITLDADLQDDINIIDEMIKEYDKGYKVVYGVRIPRPKDSFFKIGLSSITHQLLNKMNIKTIKNHVDFRLIDKTVVNEILKYKTNNINLKVLIPKLGYNSSIVNYTKNDRFAGKSKNTFNKRITSLTNIITSFSIKPLRFILYIGIITFIISLLVIIYLLILSINSITKYIIPFIFLATSLQLISLGIIGEYIGKIYSELNNKNLYVIEKDLD